MTYCIAAMVDDGLVFVSDSRTNAGIDQLSVYSKLHRFDGLQGRCLTLLTAGNLATTQAIVARLRRDVQERKRPSLATCSRLREAADYIGRVSTGIQERYRAEDGNAPFNAEANLIFGGQIDGQPPGLFHIYPQGNFVEPTRLSPFLQIGEQKYGKPILDRIIRHDTPLGTVVRCALLSMDSTMRSNAGVGPPIEMLVRSAQGVVRQYTFDEGHPYLLTLRDQWETRLRDAVDALPEPESDGSVSALKLVD